MQDGGWGERRVDRYGRMSLTGAPLAATVYPFPFTAVLICAVVGCTVTEVGPTRAISSAARFLCLPLIAT